MEKINCPNHCPANIVKDGFQRGKQRYQCKGCLKKFQSTYTYTAYNPTINKSIVTLLKEGCGIRNISRILQISKNTVLSRMLCISEKINKPVFRSLNREYEVDELWTFTGNKTNSIWVTYCIDRESKTVIDFVIGRKNKETIGKLINKVLSLAPKSIFTDGLNIYRSLLPEHIPSAAARLHRVCHPPRTIASCVPRSVAYGNVSELVIEQNVTYNYLKNSD